MFEFFWDVNQHYMFNLKNVIGWGLGKANFFFFVYYIWLKFYKIYTLKIMNGGSIKD